MDVKTVEFKPFVDQKPGTYVENVSSPPSSLLPYYPAIALLTTAETCLGPGFAKR
jgi:hypothetical protein